MDCKIKMFNKKKKKSICNYDFMCIIESNTKKTRFKIQNVNIKSYQKVLFTCAL